MRPTKHYTFGRWNIPWTSRNTNNLSWERTRKLSFTRRDHRLQGREIPVKRRLRCSLLFIAFASITFFPSIHLSLSLFHLPAAVEISTKDLNWVVFCTFNNVITKLNTTHIQSVILWPKILICLLILNFCYITILWLHGKRITF